MKAMVYTEYGSPDVLNLKEIDKPVPKNDEVLIKVRAAALNAGDWHLLRGDPFLIRIMGFGFFKPKNQILGSDVAGIVEAVGSNAKQFKPGDEVFGDLSGSGFGGFAEYVAAPEKAFNFKSSNMPFDKMAAVPISGLTALQGLRDKGQIQPGKRVLINGASGGVGTFAVQLAKSFGAEVTAVCSTKNLEMVRSLGADKVIDYTKEDFTKSGERYDIILAVSGNYSMGDYKRSLKPGGIYVGIGGSMSQMFRAMLYGPWINMSGNKKITTLIQKQSQSDLAYLKKLIDEGKLDPVIERSYNLSELPDAIRYVEAGHAGGKVIIQMIDNH